MFLLTSFSVILLKKKKERNGVFCTRALRLALLARVPLFWKKTLLGCQMHCSLVAASMTLNTIVARLRGARWAALPCPGSSPLLFPVLLQGGHVTKLWSWVHRACFLRAWNLCWSQIWGWGTRSYRMTPKSTQKCVRKYWGPWTGVLLIRTFISEMSPWSGQPLVNQPLGFHLNCLSQKSHNCPLFLGSKNQGHISEDPI